MKTGCDLCSTGLPPGSESSSFLAHEISRWAQTGKMICGHDEESWAARFTAQHGLRVARSLDELVAEVRTRTVPGVLRAGAERQVPLMICRTTSWKLWYENLKRVGNRLDGATVEWTFRVGPDKSFVLFWALHVNIYVTAEARSKSNEVVISRPDIACVLAWLPGKELLDTEIVLVREFRSPSRSSDGFIYELPGGSSFKPSSDVLQTASDELFEECGIRVEKERLHQETSRQAAATVTTHHVHLFSARLTPDEMEAARAHAAQGTVFGNASESERTRMVVTTVREAISACKADACFTTLGLIMQALPRFIDALTPDLAHRGSLGAEHER